MSLKDGDRLLKQVAIISQLNREMSKRGIAWNVEVQIPLSEAQIKDRKVQAREADKLLELDIDDPEFEEYALHHGMTPLQFSAYNRIVLDAANTTVETKRFSSLDALEFAEKMYADSVIENKQVNYALQSEHAKYKTILKQRNIFAVAAALLAILCIFFAIRSTGSSTTLPNTTAPISTTQPTSPTPRTHGNYVASVNGSKYHRPSCQYAESILEENIVYYITEAEAVSDGKKPCSVCKP